ncbi:hypothetical protein [Metabacillus arenae]|uniref:Uncharacterized protein n=1 Tax=Metabacillus arenae TaxID=2771434 RepID=A0A926NII8_9BACI|nr:hypothetical protein [Metabacillus arenae]MBD1381390.1 hypothetical protein [Metabacillus arenae]
MNELSDCPNCNALFVKTQFRIVCQECFLVEEKHFETVYYFLRKRGNKSVALKEITGGRLK